MKMNKIKIAKVVVDGNESVVLITLDRNGKKINMTGDVHNLPNFTFLLGN